MNALTRRNFMAFTVGGTVALAAGKLHAQDNAIPWTGNGLGGNDPGPQNRQRQMQNPDLVNPPLTDNGTLPNLRFSFSDAHIRKGSGGWTRQVTQRELGISTTIAGVDMRLNAGSIRELHWHKEGEWAYMLYGNARITAIDAEGRWFVDDLGVGDLWYFPPGVPHSIQGLGPDGCEFLLAFDSGNFDEDSTFLLSDWFKHIPPDVLAKNFGVPVETFSHLPSPSDEYIFAAPVPGNIDKGAFGGAGQVVNPFSHRMLAQTPIKTKGGTVRITDSSVFKVSKTIAAALVELEPGAMRELHWHPNNDEWQYYLEGEGRMGVFASSGQARTFDFRAGDVGYVPFAMGHYVENTGTTPLRFLELFKSDHYADISLNQWLALTPPALVEQHLHLNNAFMQSLQKSKTPIVPDYPATKTGTKR
ncbi:oxalate decarboxylase family bicupin [Dickeya zeae]|jgi:oxalate decarboxylase|uniref:oxalate decarboxylase family bicupin n=1 Tax=Dickeya zeae TaxID=204042 RepID=UPI00037E7D10|nr:oxalate decarboxylase family bicupin [Dickeya zeae]AUQ27011.1 cupin domain-containing protein [Dickeya zeae]PXW44295.1 oxalate decarboxylase [Erwinia sp. AG740]UJR56023.1 oxalate decarboxylase family bicupin [Dickeya zeae MS1]UJR60063.1 oxalate decarboxylase family bicupin [Dickeya zeae]